MVKKSFWKVFANRSALNFFVMLLFFLFCILRLAIISSSPLASANSTSNRLSISAGDLRGTIFDCNMVPITNNQKRILAAVSPTPRAITAISAVLEGEKLNSVLESLKSGKPTVCEVPYEIKCDGIVCTTVYSTDYENFPALHTIGYTNSDGEGVTGIEKAYNELLYSEEQVRFIYEIAANGSILEGVKATVENNSSIKANGVVTTIDLNIQNIAETHAQALESGAIVIAEVKTGKIRAVTSRPTFEVGNISKYLSLENSPFLNRALSAYNVGSVFKPCVAAAAIENSLGNFTFACEGSTLVADRYFKCHKKAGHGFCDMRYALAFSCNVFFYNLAFKTGGKSLLSIAGGLKFGNSLKLCENIYTAKGNLPSESEVENIGALANLSIGQGTLLLSPISMLTLYSSIANNGVYFSPSLVEGTFENGEYKEYNIGNPTKAMQNSTATKLKNYLAEVLTMGTGSEATPKTVTAAGKTATAQTGKYENGAEICSGWFCGFFPLNNPEYAVIVFSENTSRQDFSCSKIFSLIADDITALKH